MSEEKLFVIYGQSMAAAYLAGRLAREGAQVEWQVPAVAPERPRRPLRISARRVRELSAYLRGAQIDVRFLDRAPSLEGWCSADGRKFFPTWSWQGELGLDRWVSAAQLGDALTAAARYFGVQETALERTPRPSFESGRIQIFDLSPERLRSWPDACFETRKARHFTTLTEVSLPKGEFREGRTHTRFHAFDGRVIAFCEADPAGGWVMSLHATRALWNDNYLARLADAQDLSMPLPWRALLMLNASPLRTEYKVCEGPARLVLPGGFMLGESIGRYPLFANRKCEESLEQVERLMKRLMPLRWSTDGAVFAASEASQGEEKSLFARRYQRLQRWRQLFLGGTFERLAAPALSWVPTAFRHKLKSPL